MHRRWFAVLLALVALLFVGAFGVMPRSPMHPTRRSRG
jgi:hypothetical protein